MGTKPTKPRREKERTGDGEEPSPTKKRVTSLAEDEDVVSMEVGKDDFLSETADSDFAIL